MRIVLAWAGPRDAAERTIFTRRHVPLLQHLIAQGVEPVIVLLGDDAGTRAALEATGARVEISVALPPPISLLYRLPIAVKKLRAIIDEVKPDLVEGATEMPAIAGGLAARGRAKSIYRRHFHIGRLRLHLSSRIAAMCTDRVIVSNETMRQHAAAHLGKPLHEIEVASSGAAEPANISADDVRNARHSLGIDDGDFVVVRVAFLRKDKGNDVLIRAMREVDGAHLIIAGSGPEEDALRKLAANQPVHFLGHRDDVDLWMSAADVVAIPSRSEAFGRVTLEAMALGKAIVASRAGGLSEAIVDGENGLLVPPDDAGALANALRTLAADRARVERMGRASRARYESRFTIAHMATSWREAWERIRNS